MDRNPSSKPSARRRRGLAPAGLVALVLTAPAAVAAQAQAPAASPINWAFSLDSEIVDNLGGGIAPGSVGDTLLRLGFVLDGGAMGLPQGSRIKATLQRTQSGQPSATRVGDAQSVTNIEAASRSRF